MADFSGIIYVSKASILFTRDNLNELVIKAQATNKKLGITGFLYFEENKFLQFFEGPEESTTHLMKCISQDDRHEILASFEQPTRESRFFEKWSMTSLVPEAYITVRMETVLMNYTSWFGSYYAHSNHKNLERIWGMVEKLSKLRAA